MQENGMFAPELSTAKTDEKHAPNRKKDHQTVVFFAAAGAGALAILKFCLCKRAQHKRI